MLDFNLKGKTALVAGCDHEEGRQIARRLAEAGAYVVLHSENQAAETTDFVGQMKCRGLQAEAVCGRSACFSDAANLANEVREKYGAIDILVNDFHEDADVSCLELTNDHWNASVRTNLFCVFNMMKSVVEMMVEAGQGTIVNITSSSAFSGMAGNLAYSASQAAVHALTLAASKEMEQKGIRINSIAPSRIVETACDQIAFLAVFLASPLAKGISGEIFRLNAREIRKEDEHVSL